VFLLSHFFLKVKRTAEEVRRDGWGALTLALLMQYPEAKDIINPPDVLNSKLMTSLRDGVSPADLLSAADDLEQLLWVFQRSMPDRVREKPNFQQLKLAFVEEIGRVLSQVPKLPAVLKKASKSTVCKTN
jgi:hypothetical protein